MARAIGEGVMDRALGLLGLFLMGLIGWASAWGRPGRVVIGLVTAIGWMIDRLSLKQESRAVIVALVPGTPEQAGATCRRAARQIRGARAFVQEHYEDPFRVD